VLRAAFRLRERYDSLQLHTLQHRSPEVRNRQPVTARAIPCCNNAAFLARREISHGMPRLPRLPILRNGVRHIVGRERRSTALAVAVAILPGGGILLVLWLLIRRSKVQQTGLRDRAASRLLTHPRSAE
jgi:hypothetical protein